MTDVNQPNRRQYYRIQDQVGLEFQRLSQDEDIRDLFEDRVTLGLHQELRRIDQDVRQQLAALADRDRNLAFLIKSLNHKIDTLARIMAFEQKPLQPEQWHRVTLSEGGVAFDAGDETLAPGDRLALRLTLMPELQRILLQGEVVEIVNDSGQPQVHVSFLGLSDSDRQAIARHVIRAQARQRQDS